MKAFGMLKGGDLPGSWIYHGEIADRGKARAEQEAELAALYPRYSLYRTNRETGRLDLVKRGLGKDGAREE